MRRAGAPFKVWAQALFKGLAGCRGGAPAQPSAMALASAIAFSWAAGGAVLITHEVERKAAPALGHGPQIDGIRPHLGHGNLGGDDLGPDLLVLPVKPQDLSRVQGDGLAAPAGRAEAARFYAGDFSQSGCSSGTEMR